MNFIFNRILSLVLFAVLGTNIGVAHASACRANMEDVPLVARTALMRKGYISDKNSSIVISISHEKIHTLIRTEYETDTRLGTAFDPEGPRERAVTTYYDQYQQVLSVSVAGDLVQQNSSVYSNRSGHVDPYYKNSVIGLAKKVYSPRKMNRKFNACN